MNSLAKLLIVALVITFSVGVLAGTKMVKSGLTKNGQLTHKQVQVTKSLSDTDPQYWKNFSNLKSRPNKLYREPFGQVYVAPHNDQTEIDYEPEAEDFTNSPFDTK